MKKESNEMELAFQFKFLNKRKRKFCILRNIFYKHNVNFTRDRTRPLYLSVALPGTGFHAVAETNTQF